jgi:cytochrome P450
MSQPVPASKPTDATRRLAPAREVSRLSRKAEGDLSLYQLLKPEVLADPYPLYRRLREYEPVHWDPYLNSWIVSSYAEAVTALAKFKSPRTRSPELMEAMGLGPLSGYARIMLDQIPFMDAPDHTRIRSVCSVAFTPARVALLQREIERIAEALIDRVADRGEMDIVADFAGQLPAQVVTAMLGLPAEDCFLLRRWATDYGELVGTFDHNASRVDQLATSLNELHAYLSAFIAAQLQAGPQRARPGIISTLIASEVEGVRLTADQILSNSMLFLNAGLDETGSLIANGMFSLLERPAQFAQLRDHPEVLPSAIEELLRFESTTQYTGRVVPEETLLGGKLLRPGQSVTVVLAAANRDPLRFPHPNELNLKRADNRHLAFSWGAHYCLGAPLVRLMAKTAFSTLLLRLPELSLVQQQIEWRSMAAMRGLKNLQVRFEATHCKGNVG